MSKATDSPDLERAETVEQSGNSGDWIDLDGGETFTGEVTAFRPEASYNGILEIDGRPYQLNASLRRQLIEAFIIGQTVGVGREDKQVTDEIDGDEVSYYPRFLLVPNGGDE